jgi:hypothetical protein
MIARQAALRRTGRIFWTTQALRGLVLFRVSVTEIESIRSRQT